MKKLMICSLILTLGAMTCSGKKDAFSLEKNTKSYDLAKEIAAIFPSLDPDKTFILIKTNRFRVTAGEAIHELRLNMGLDENTLKKLGPSNLEALIMENAFKLAEKKMLLDAAEKSGIEVSEAEIAEALKREYDQAGGEAKFFELIKKNDVDIEYIKNDIRKELMIERYLDEKVYSDVVIQEDEIQELYFKDKTATIRHILLRTQGKEDQEKQQIRERMEEILKRTKAGEDFSELARKYSQDSASKDKGGLYENFARGSMLEPLERVAFSLPVGEISDIIETPLGFHIIKIINRKKEHRPLEEVYDELKAAISIRKKREAYLSHLEMLKQTLVLKTARF